MEKLDRRDFRFIAVCLLVIAAGAAVTSVLFRRAFPEASIKFEVDRAGAVMDALAVVAAEQACRDGCAAAFGDEPHLEDLAGGHGRQICCQ